MKVEQGKRYEVKMRKVRTTKEGPVIETSIIKVRSVERREGFQYVGYDCEQLDGRKAWHWGYMRIDDAMPQEWGVQSIREVEA